MAKSTMDALAFLRKHLEGEGGSDLLREMVKAFAEALMSAEASAMCGASYGERTPERVNSRNGYRVRQFDTRVGSIELAIPKLRRGSYFPDWLVEPRRRAERALVQVVCQCYVEGVSTRAVDDVVRALGMQGISKSQVSEWALALDEVVEAFRSRPLERGPYTYVWLDALTQKVREGGRIVNVAVVVGQRRQRRRPAGDPGQRLRSPPKTAPAGPPSCGTWWPGACRGSSWSSATTTVGSSRRSRRCCPAPAGSGAGCISCATC